MLHEDDAEDAEEAPDEVDDPDMDEAEPAAELDDDLDLDSMISGTDRARPSSQGQFLCPLPVSRVLLAAGQLLQAPVMPSTSQISPAGSAPACQEYLLDVDATCKTALSFRNGSECSSHATKSAAGLSYEPVRRGLFGSSCNAQAIHHGLC